jgi:hypothetical protein
MGQAALTPTTLSGNSNLELDACLPGMWEELGACPVLMGEQFVAVLGSKAQRL